MVHAVLVSQARIESLSLLTALKPIPEEQRWCRRANVFGISMYEYTSGGPVRREFVAAKPALLPPSTASSSSSSSSSSSESVPSSPAPPFELAAAPAPKLGCIAAAAAAAAESPTLTLTRRRRRCRCQNWGRGRGRRRERRWARVAVVLERARCHGRSFWCCAEATGAVS